MELVLLSLGILGVLIAVAAVMDVRARRTRKRLTVDPGGVLDHRRHTMGRYDLHDGPG